MIHLSNIGQNGECELCKHGAELRQGGLIIEESKEQCSLVVV